MPCTRVHAWGSRLGADPGGELDAADLPRTVRNGELVTVGTQGRAAATVPHQLRQRVGWPITPGSQRARAGRRGARSGTTLPSGNAGHRTAELAIRRWRGGQAPARRSGERRTSSAGGYTLVIDGDVSWIAADETTRGPDVARGTSRCQSAWRAKSRGRLRQRMSSSAERWRGLHRCNARRITAIPPAKWSTTAACARSWWVGKRLGAHRHHGSSH
jgi:hypothetical protein